MYIVQSQINSKDVDNKVPVHLTQKSFIYVPTASPGLNASALLSVVGGELCLPPEESVLSGSPWSPWLRALRGEHAPQPRIGSRQQRRLLWLSKGQRSVSGSARVFACAWERFCWKMAICWWLWASWCRKHLLQFFTLCHLFPPSYLFSLPSFFPPSFVSSPSAVFRWVVFQR